MKTSHRSSLGILLTSLFFVAGCAHTKTDQQINTQLQKEPEISSTSELDQSARSAIEKSSQLSSDQKARLLSLEEQTHAKSFALREESLKLRSLLVHTLLQPKYQRTEIDRLKDRIKKVENERVQLTFDSIDQANAIMGRPTDASEQVMRSFYEPPVGSHQAESQAHAKATRG